MNRVELRSTPAAMVISTFQHFNARQANRAVLDDSAPPSLFETNRGHQRLIAAAMSRARTVLGKHRVGWRFLKLRTRPVCFGSVIAWSDSRRGPTSPLARDGVRGRPRR